MSQTVLILHRFHIKAKSNFLLSQNSGAITISLLINDQWAVQPVLTFVVKAVLLHQKPSWLSWHSCHWAVASACSLALGNCGWHLLISFCPGKPEKKYEKCQSSVMFSLQNNCEQHVGGNISENHLCVGKVCKNSTELLLQHQGAFKQQHICHACFPSHQVQGFTQNLCSLRDVHS